VSASPNRKSTIAGNFGTTGGRQVTKKSTKAPAAVAPNPGRFAHLMQGRAQFEALQASRTPEAVAARIVAAGKMRRGEIE
jgi:hypothetical protein